MQTPKNRNDALAQWYRARMDRVAGIDEAGRGPLAGPVVAAAVVLDPSRPIPGLADSKTLTRLQREALHAIIQQNALAYSVAVVDVAVIDAINILQATLRAMAVAFDNVQRQCSDSLVGALVDGNQRAPLDPSIVQHVCVKGDATWRPIMAASILAKVERDAIMLQLDTEYPGYDFASHKGYGTAAHIDAIRRLGTSPVHRSSFHIKELGRP